MKNGSAALYLLKYVKLTTPLIPLLLISELSTPRPQAAEEGPQTTAGQCRQNSQVRIQTIPGLA